MKKLNWGHGIAIFLVVFLLFNVFVFIFAFNQDIQLVTDNYYDKELKYEAEINKMNNVANLPDSLKIKLDKLNLFISYPKSLLNSNLKGKVHLYRPDESKFDYNTDIQYDSLGVQTINMSEKAVGLWEISVTLNDGAKDYLFKDKIYLK
jgi:hypothetical protein